MVEHVLPEDDHEAERVARQAKLYVLIDGELTGGPRTESSYDA